MADLLRIKQNVSKMVNMGAPEQDIDDYISAEGVTVDDVRNFKPLKPSFSGSKAIAEKAGEMTTSENPLVRLGGKALIPYAALTGMGEDLIKTPTAHFVNQLALNFPRSIARTMGNEYPERANSPVGQGLASLAGLAGAFLSPTGQIAKGAVQAPLKLTNLLKLAGAGAAGGFAYAPSDNFGDIKQRGEQAGVGAIVGAAIPPVAKGVSKLPGFFKNAVNNIKNVKNPVQFSQNVRRVLFQQKKAVGDAFESGIQQLSKDNPTKSVDLSDAFKYIKTSIDDIQNNPGLSSEIKGALRKVRNPELAQTIQTLIDDPSKAKNLTLAQSQEIKGIIQQATSIAGKSQQGAFAQYKPGDLELLDLVDEIKLAQSEAFPEMAKIREPYAKYMGAYRVVKNKFKPGALLEKMRNGFGDEEIQDMVKIVLPQDTVKQIAGFRKVGKGVNAALKIGGAGIALEGGRRLLRKTMGD